MQHNEGVFSATRFSGVVVRQINAQPGREPTGYRLRDPEVGTVGLRTQGSHIVIESMFVHPAARMFLR